MQNNPKEPQPPGRQRPLQKSMFLPDHYPPQAFIHPAQQQNINEFQQYNPLKRSLLDNPTMPPTSPQYQFRAQNNQSFTPTSYQQNTNIQGQFMAVQPRQGSHHQLLHHSTSLTTMKQASILMDRGPQGNNDSMTKNIARFQKQPGTEMKTITKSMPDAIQHQKIVADVVNLIKEKHLPTLVSIVKKELHDQLNTFKQEFNQFKQEFKNHLGKQEALNNELKNGLTRSPNGSSKHDKSPTPKHKQKDSQLSELQKELFLLQNKLNKLQGSNKQNFNYFGEQLEKIWQRIKQKHKKQQKTAFKVSNIKSSLSAIMLEYKQLFAIKKQTNENQKRVSQQQILLSTCQYYVDRQGFLMDSENHYLVDHKGNQIRLQQKHIKLLQQHKILNR